MTDIIKTMANEIIELKLRLFKKDIGSGNCPFVMYPLKTNLKIDCSKVSCRECNNIWTKHKRKEIAKEVYKRYELAEKGKK